MRINALAKKLQVECVEILRGCQKVGVIGKESPQDLLSQAEVNLLVKHYQQNSWKQFEKNVRELLELQGWSVSKEKIIGHKKVDAFAEKTGEFMQRTRVGVECKHYDKAVSKLEITKIYADYHPLLDTDSIDRLLLVTSNGVSPSAETFVENAKDIIHITYANLLNSSMDFSQYVYGMKAQYGSSELSRLYTTQSAVLASNEVADVAESIVLWTQQEDERPLAVLGGYGMGKTTLASRLAYLLASSHIANSFERIPILIKLEDISTDQSLEGLLGKHFTSKRAKVSNYNFDIFMRLNNSGRFVILLDGFDEMKKTMSWESLRFNLNQLNRLVKENSKVILLGRPTAFLNSDEHNEALHGKRLVQGVERSIPGWPDYHECHLESFGIEQIQSYLRKYIEVNSDNEKKCSPIKRLHGILNDDNGHHIADLASRPVQLKMLLDILPDYGGNLEQLTESMLYSEFVDLVIRRELEKISRITYNIDQRRSFASRLALWMWKNSARLEIQSSEIPDEVFYDFRKPNIPLDAVKRDLVSGCFLERKPPEGLYLPHRSFLEFLVADRIVEMVKSRSREVLSLSFITPEISAFFVELIGKKAVTSWRQWFQRVGDSETQVSAQSMSLFRVACKKHGIRLTKSLIDKLTKVEVKPLVIHQQDKPSEAEMKQKRKQAKFPHRRSGVTRKKDRYKREG